MRVGGCWFDKGKKSEFCAQANLPGGHDKLF